MSRLRSFVVPFLALVLILKPCTHPRNESPPQSYHLLNTALFNSTLNNLSYTPPVSVRWTAPDSPAQLKLSIPRHQLTSPTTTRLLALASDCHSTPLIHAIYCPVPGAAQFAITSHLRAKHCVLPLSQLALRDRERALVRTSVFRFTFARHPFLRALSAYRRGIRPDITGGLRGTTNRTFAGRVSGTPLPFRFFLAFLSRRVLPADVPPDELSSQTSACDPRRMHFHFVGDVDKLVEGLHVVNARLGIHSTILPLHNSSGALAAAHEIFGNARVRRKAARLFHDDLLAFGFSPRQFGG